MPIFKQAITSNRELEEMKNTEIMPNMPKSNLLNIIKLNVNDINNDLGLKQLEELLNGMRDIRNLKYGEKTKLMKHKFHKSQDKPTKS